MEMVLGPFLLIAAVLIPAPGPVHSPHRSTRNHALLEAAGPSHVAINAISANMDSFSSSRTAALKKQPSHMEAAHFGDLGKASSALQDCQQFLFSFFFSFLYAH